MSFKTVKLKWARKLLKARMFVVLTEKESAIAIDGADPFTFTDALALAAQSAELQMFHDSLGNLIADHQAALQKLSGEPNHAAEPQVETEKTPAGSATDNAATITKAVKQSRPVRSKVRSSKPSTKAKTAPKNK